GVGGDRDGALAVAVVDREGTAHTQAGPIDGERVVAVAVGDEQAAHGQLVGQFRVEVDGAPAHPAVDRQGPGNGDVAVADRHRVVAVTVQHGDAAEGLVAGAGPDGQGVVAPAAGEGQVAGQAGRVHGDDIVAQAGVQLDVVDPVEVQRGQ